MVWADWVWWGWGWGSWGWVGGGGHGGGWRAAAGANAGGDCGASGRYGYGHLTRLPTQICPLLCVRPGGGAAFYAYNTMRNPRVAAMAGGFGLAYLFAGWVVGGWVGGWGTGSMWMWTGWVRVGTVKRAIAWFAVG